MLPLTIKEQERIGYKEVQVRTWFAITGQRLQLVNHSFAELVVGLARMGMADP